MLLAFIYALIIIAYLPSPWVDLEGEEAMLVLRITGDIERDVDGPSVCELTYNTMTKEPRELPVFHTYDVGTNILGLTMVHSLQDERVYIDTCENLEIWSSESNIENPVNAVVPVQAPTCKNDMSQLVSNSVGNMVIPNVDEADDLDLKEMKPIIEHGYSGAVLVQRESFLDVLYRVAYYRVLYPSDVIDKAYLFLSETIAWLADNVFHHVDHVGFLKKIFDNAHRFRLSSFYDTTLDHVTKNGVDEMTSKSLQKKITDLHFSDYCQAVEITRDLEMIEPGYDELLYAVVPIQSPIYKNDVGRLAFNIVENMAVPSICESDDLHLKELKPIIEYGYTVAVLVRKESFLDVLYRVSYKLILYPSDVINRVYLYLSETILWLADNVFHHVGHLGYFNKIFDNVQQSRLFSFYETIIDATKNGVEIMASNSVQKKSPELHFSDYCQADKISRGLELIETGDDKLIYAVVPVQVPTCKNDVYQLSCKSVENNIPYVCSADDLYLKERKPILEHGDIGKHDSSPGNLALLMIFIAVVILALLGWKILQKKKEQCKKNNNQCHIKQNLLWKIGWLIKAVIKKRNEVQHIEAVMNKNDEVEEAKAFINKTDKVRDAKSMMNNNDKVKEAKVVMNKGDEIKEAKPMMNKNYEIKEAKSVLNKNDEVNYTKAMMKINDEVKDAKSDMNKGDEVKEAKAMMNKNDEVKEVKAVMNKNDEVKETKKMMNKNDEETEADVTSDEIENITEQTNKEEKLTKSQKRQLKKKQNKLNRRIRMENSESTKCEREKTTLTYHFRLNKEMGIALITIEKNESSIADLEEAILNKEIQITDLSVEFIDKIIDEEFNSEEGSYGRKRLILKYQLRNTVNKRDEVAIPM